MMYIDNTMSTKLVAVLMLVSMSDVLLNADNGVLAVTWVHSAVR